MPFCRFAEGAGMYDVTPIENMFLLEYLPSAPEGFLRVYLYARMLTLHPELGEDIADMARALRMDEESVYNAMTYWERQGLVCRLTDRPPTYQLLSVNGAAARDPMEADYYELRDFNASLQSLFGPENLLGPKQYAMAYDWLNVYGYTQDAALRLVEFQVKKSRSKSPSPARIFKKADEMAGRWAERGARTLEDVEKAILFDGQAEKTASAVLRQLGVSRAPSVDEMRLAAKWLDEWGFTTEEILSACAETTKSRNPSFAYLNSILESRRRGDAPVFEGAQAAKRELDAQGGAPTADEQQRYAGWLKQGFEPETVRLAAIQCCRKNQHRFEDLERMLSRWAPMKLFRADEAEAYVQRMSRLTAEVATVLDKCGTDRRPQMEDLRLYEGWTKTASEELIAYAAECARGMQLPMRYIDRLLTEWGRSGVRTADEARAQHENRAARTAQPAANPALQYEQREHSESDYDDLYIDLSKLYGEGGDGK